MVVATGSQKFDFHHHPLRTSSSLDDTAPAVDIAVSDPSLAGGNTPNGELDAAAPP